MIQFFLSSKVVDMTACINFIPDAQTRQQGDRCGIVLLPCKFNYSTATMKKDKKNIKEPYEPNDTPKPPQVIEPNSGRERENPVTEDERTEASARNEKRSSPDAAHSEKQHLLADDAEIDDETTI